MKLCGMRLASVSIFGALFCSSCGPSTDASRLGRVGTVAQATAADQLAGVAKTIGYAADKVGGYYSVAKGATDAVVFLGGAMGIINSQPSMQDLLTQLNLHIDQVAQNISWLVIAEDRETTVGHMVSDVNTALDALQRGDRPDFVNLDFAFNRTVTDATKSTAFDRYYIASDTDGQWACDSTCSRYFRWKDVVFYHESDLNIHNGYVYDWRLGVPALMQVLALRLQLMAMEDPNLLIDHAFPNVLKQYHDALLSNLHTIEAGIRCGTIWVPSVGWPGNDGVPYKEHNDYMVSCADIYTGTNITRNVQVPMIEPCCYEIGPESNPQMICDSVCVGDSTWFANNVPPMLAQMRQDTRNTTIWFEIRALADSLFVIGNSLADLTRSIDGKIHTSAFDLCMSADSQSERGIVTIETCDADIHSPQQRWEYDRKAQTIVNVSSGLCLEAPDCSPETFAASGACPPPTQSTATFSLVTATCNGGDAQRWTYSHEDQLLYNARGMVAEVGGEVSNSGQLVRANLITDFTNQKWQKSPDVVIDWQQSPDGAWTSNPQPFGLSTMNAQAGSTIMWGYTAALGNIYTGSINLAEGENTIYYALVDPQGNVGPVQETIVRVDTRAPAAVPAMSPDFTALNFTVNDPSPGSGGAALHAIVTTNGVAAPEQVVQGAAGTLAIGPSFSTIEYWAEDVAGNLSPHSIVANVSPTNGDFEGGFDAPGKPHAWVGGYATLVDGGYSGQAARLGVNASNNYIDMSAYKAFGIPVSSTSRIVVSVAARADAAFYSGGSLADVEYNICGANCRTTGILGGYALDVRGSPDQLKPVSQQKTLPPGSLTYVLRLRARGTGNVDFDSVHVAVIQ